MMYGTSNILKTAVRFIAISKVQPISKSVWLIYYLTQDQEHSFMSRELSKNLGRLWLAYTDPVEIGHEKP